MPLSPTSALLVTGSSSFRALRNTWSNMAALPGEPDPEVDLCVFVSAFYSRCPRCAARWMGMCPVFLATLASAP